MAAPFTVNIGADAMTAQLNAMRDELVARFAANEEEHRQLRAASEAMRTVLDKLETEVSDLRTLQATMQLNLTTTTDQARTIFESIVAESRQALTGVRGEGLMIGAEFLDPTTHAPAQKLVGDLEQLAFRKGLLLLSCGKSTIRFAPPLVVTEHEIDITIRLLDECLTELAAAEAT
jgi:4-aminobutyrate aminotransferase-like enzyme